MSYNALKSAMEEARKKGEGIEAGAQARRDSAAARAKRDSTRAAAARDSAKAAAKTYNPRSRAPKGDKETAIIKNEIARVGAINAGTRYMNKLRKGR